jgi:hypothetical protein
VSGKGCSLSLFPLTLYGQYGPNHSLWVTFVTRSLNPFSYYSYQRIYYTPDPNFYIIREYGIFHVKYLHANAYNAGSREITTSINRKHFQNSVVFIFRNSAEN